MAPHANMSDDEILADMRQRGTLSDVRGNQRSLLSDKFAYAGTEFGPVSSEAIAEVIDIPT